MKFGLTLAYGGWVLAALLVWRGYDLWDENSLAIRRVRQALETEMRERVERENLLLRKEGDIAGLEKQLDSVRRESEKLGVEEQTRRAAALEGERRAQAEVSPFVAGLLKKVKHAEKLEAELARRPLYEIPELSYLRETDWLRISERLGDNPSEEQYEDALGSLLYQAKQRWFSHLEEMGKKAGVWQHIKQIGSIDALKASLVSASVPLEQAEWKALDRYEIVPKEELKGHHAWGIVEKAPVGGNSFFSRARITWQITYLDDKSGLGSYTGPVIPSEP
ncbi:MAG: hypothetical protein RLZZ142_1197 [Verrucomicrobiota bacterium]|jgi:hypothetical protein